MARSYHMSQIPGASRKARAVIDWTASLPFSRDISEVGSIGRPGVLNPDRYLHGGSHRPVEGDLPAAGRDRAEADAGSAGETA
jgi:hypothetical protein